MLNKNNIKTLAALIAAIITVSALASCSANTAQTNPIPEDTTTSISTTTAPETVKPETVSTTAQTTPPSQTSTTEPEKEIATETQTTTTAKTTAAQTTTVTTKATTTTAAPAPAPEWTESKMSATMYVNTAGIYSRKKAIIGAEKVKSYALNDAVNVVASTNTDYYKLADGSFIHKDYLSMGKTVIQTTAATQATKPVDESVPSSNNSKEAQALKVAQKIADEVKKEAGEKQSVEQLWCATKKVYGYTKDCKYDESNPDALTAYGAFVAKTATCQGCTDALGMVLDILGYKWEHINKNEYTHQLNLIYFNYNVEDDFEKNPNYNYFDDFYVNDLDKWTGEGTVILADAQVGIITLD